jgi:teichuronic acid biosynthesis glycosyltransferase TuaC
MLNILTLTSLYPNGIHPGHGVFVENRLRHLVEVGGVHLRVVAPVPWFPFEGGVFGQYGEFAKIPKEEKRAGISIIHPRFPVIPKIGMNYGPQLMFWALKPVLAKILSERVQYDLIDAHYFYPDGVAASMLAQFFNIPVVITARGSDVNVISQFKTPKRQILWASNKAAQVITVSDALKNTLIGLGAESKNIQTLRNGVDLEMFTPINRFIEPGGPEAPHQALLSVGNLVELKGHHIAIKALSSLPNATLKIAGDGPERQNLSELATRLGLLDRVNFLGRIPHDELSAIYGDADALVLASRNEGWPNVLLEAMACGTPAIANNVGGVPEIVATPESGVLMEERTPEALAAATRLLFDNMPDRAATRAYAEQFSWDATTQSQLDLFHAIAGKSRNL